MKICILSMQEVQNYGSLLQAYALKRMINELGHSAKFLHIKKNEQDNRLIKESDDFLEDIEENGILKKVDKYLYNRILDKRRVKQQFALLDKFRNENLPFGDNENFDYCVIGSDEVFNCMLSSKWGFTSQLFGNVKQANKVITYAASCGSTKVENVPLNVKNVIKKCFLDISAFSVRDMNTEKFVRSLTNANDVVKNLDPVFVTNFDEEIEQVCLPDNFPRRYCIVYSYPNRFHNKEDINEIKKFASANNLTLISLGGYQMWINKPIALSPFQLLKAFKNAEFVITDTFHGSIFSAKYAKHFGIIVRNSNENKLNDLIDSLEIESHKISHINKKYLEQIYKIRNDFSSVKELENIERKKALEYLRTNIK